MNLKIAKKYWVYTEQKKKSVGGRNEEVWTGSIRKSFASGEGGYTVTCSWLYEPTYVRTFVRTQCINSQISHKSVVRTDLCMQYNTTIYVYEYGRLWSDVVFLVNRHPNVRTTACLLSGRRRTRCREFCRNMSTRVPNYLDSKRRR
jgi:hypothetical protein